MANSKSTHLEDLFLTKIREAGLPEPELQCQLIPGRKFRFDFTWYRYPKVPHFLLGPGAINRVGQPWLTVEVQGGTWVMGGHSSGAGIAKDCEKTILAQLEGWKVFPVTSNQIKDGSAIEWVRRALA